MENKPPARDRLNGIFMLCVGSIASVIGFGYTYLQSKRGEINELTSQTTSRKVQEQILLMRDGTRLASRAFAYSWIFSIGGVSLLAYSAWKITGAKNLVEFRQAAGEVLPVIPKSENSGRNNFESLKDLANYLEEEDKRHMEKHRHVEEDR